MKKLALVGLAFVGLSSNAMAFTTNHNDRGTPSLDRADIQTSNYVDHSKVVDTSLGMPSLDRADIQATHYVNDAKGDMTSKNATNEEKAEAQFIPDRGLF